MLRSVSLNFKCSTPLPHTHWAWVDSSGPVGMLVISPPAVYWGPATMCKADLLLLIKVCFIFPDVAKQPIVCPPRASDVPQVMFLWQHITEAHLLTFTSLSLSMNVWSPSTLLSATWTAVRQELLSEQASFNVGTSRKLFFTHIWSQITPNNFLIILLSLSETEMKVEDYPF